MAGGTSEKRTTKSAEYWTDAESGGCVLSDIEIAQKAKLKPIAENAAGLGTTDPELMLPNGSGVADVG